MLVTVLIIIIVVLLVVGGFLYYKNQGLSSISQNVPVNNYSPTVNQNSAANNPSTTPSSSSSTSTTTTTVTTTQNVPTKTYNNTEAGYSINYPSNWQVPKIVEQSKDSSFDRFEIQNIPNVVIPSDMSFNLKNNGSLIVLEVHSDTPSAKLATVDDWVKTDELLTQQQIQQRLSYISLMNIGGKNIRVLKLINSEELSNSNSNDIITEYDFIYNGKTYSMSFQSGSQSQYSLDSTTFNNFMASFTLL